METRGIFSESSVGGVDNNMPPQKTKAGGIDWLELSVFADLTPVWGGTNFEGGWHELFQRALESAKEEQTEQIVHVFDHHMAVQQYGTQFGTFNYPFRCVDQKDLIWWFRKDPIEHANIPAVRVRISGETCLCSECSVKELVEWIYEFFNALGVVPSKLSVSRIDLCVDLAGVDIADFKHAHFSHDYVTRSKSQAVDSTGTIDKETWRYMQSRGLTLYYGRSPLTLRAYDKLAELNHKLNPRKWQAMINRRWGGVEPAAATRVEFELRREALKKLGIDTIEDFFKKQGELVYYLTNNWFRYVEPPREGQDNRKNRWPTHARWKDTQNAFNEIFQTGADGSSDLSPLPKDGVDVSALSKQSFGVAMKAAELEGKEFSKYSDFISYCVNFHQEAAKKKFPEWFETHTGHRGV